MNLEKYRRPFVFFGFSIGIPWVLWSITGAISHSVLWENYNWVIFGSILAFFGLLAPMVTAMILILPDKEMRDELKSATFSFKGVHWIWFAYTFLFPFAVILLSQTISLLFGHSTEQFKIVEKFSFSAGIFPVWVLFIFVPIIEEFGWRTYGTHCIRRKFNLFTTSIIFGVLWAIWHMPLSFINGYYHSNLVETGAIYSINYTVSLIPYLIIDGWVYYKSKRNMMIQLFTHFTWNVLMEMFNTHPDSKLIHTAVLIIFCVVILIKDRKFFFERKFDIEGVS